MGLRDVGLLGVEPHGDVAQAGCTEPLDAKVGASTSYSPARRPETACLPCAASISTAFYLAPARVALRPPAAARFPICWAHVPGCRYRLVIPLKHPEWPLRDLPVTLTQLRASPFRESHLHAVQGQPGSRFAGSLSVGCDNASWSQQASGLANTEDRPVRVLQPPTCPPRESSPARQVPPRSRFSGRPAVRFQQTLGRANENTALSGQETIFLSNS